MKMEYVFSIIIHVWNLIKNNICATTFIYLIQRYIKTNHIFLNQPKGEEAQRIPSRLPCAERQT